MKPVDPPSASEGSTRRTRVLYISYHGVASALVRSQVLPYLRGLADIAEFHLLSYEGASSEDDPPADETRGIVLHRLRYHRRPNLPAKILDIVAGIVFAFWLVFRHDIDLIHARSHVAAAIAAATGLVLRRPWIFDMRGFLADEFVEAGSWRAGGLKYRLVRAVERGLLLLSDAIVVLTERGRKRLSTEPAYAGSIAATPIAVIPCCIELERYQVAPAHGGAPTLVYLGSVGTWYLLNEMLSFFKFLRAARPGSTFVIVNRGQHAAIFAAIARTGLPPDSIRVLSADFNHVPGILVRCSAGIVLLREGLSKLGSSPIKLSEYLACGLPVVVNRAVGDAPELLGAAGAGVVLNGTDDRSLEEGAAKLLALLDEGEDARRRARALADSHYSLATGVQAYRRLYAALLARTRGAPAS